LLKESLRGWRNYYCDHENRWHGCARYKMSVTGQLVPITLLPNGHDAQYLPDADRSGAIEAVHALPSRPRPGPPKPKPMNTAWFEAAPAPAAAPAPFEPSPQVPHPPGTPPARSPRRARRAHGSIRRWWTRLTDWMTGPA
jgi:hypothetical protein